MPYPPQGYALASQASQRYQVSPSDDLLASSDSEISTSSLSYVMGKQIKVNASGTIRVYFELHDGATCGASARVARNGIGVGTVRSTTSTSYVAFTEDIADWLDGDLCQLFFASDYTYGYAYVRNFRIKGKISTIVSPPIARVDL
jgi:hypothetical protein